MLMLADDRYPAVAEISSHCPRLAQLPVHFSSSDATMLFYAMMQGGAVNLHPVLIQILMFFAMCIQVICGWHSTQWSLR